MQYSFSALALLAVAGLAAAQIPVCAQSCLDTATKAACGDPKDYACACTPANQAKIQGSATNCVLAACGPTVAVQQVLPAAKALCDSLASSSAAPASTSSSEAAPSSTAVETSSAAASASSYSASAAPSTTTTAVVPVTTGSSNGTAAPTSTPASFTGGAAQATAAGLGSVFALGMAVLAAF